MKLVQSPDIRSKGVQSKGTLSKGIQSKGKLEKILYRSFMLLAALISVLTLAAALYFDMSRERNNIDRIISGTAAYIAEMPEVEVMLENSYLRRETRAAIDLVSANIPDISVILICDQNGLRYYHTDRRMSGDTFVNGDEAAILTGSEPYITTGYGTLGNQRRAFHAVVNDEEEIIGFVMVSEFTSRISEKHRSILLVHVAIFLLMMAASFPLTHLFLGVLRKSLLGYQPEELVSRYIQRNEVVNALDEGVIATDKEGTIIFANRLAEELFRKEEGGLAGISIETLYPDTRLKAVMAGGESTGHQSFSISNRNVMVNEVPLCGDEPEDIRGMLVILLDKTELMNLSDELSGARSMMDTLRAFNHEFLNKLHIILGYLQTGQIQHAIDFINNSSLVSSQSIRETANNIRVSRICALVIGKMMHAAELGISLTVNPDSSCREADLMLPVDSYITVIGNLLENAIEELSEKETGCREILLGVYCRPDCSIITCEDTGGGICPEVLPHIFEKGISTKGDNRGTGLSLVREICENYGGEISIDTELGEGSCFTVTFIGKEK